MDAYKNPTDREILLDLLAEVREMRKILADLTRPAHPASEGLTQEERDYITAEWVRQVLAEKDVDRGRVVGHKQA